MGKEGEVEGQVREGNGKEGGDSNKGKEDEDRGRGKRVEAPEGERG